MAARRGMGGATRQLVAIIDAGEGRLIDRRAFLGVVGCALGAVPTTARSQQTGIRRIGYLHPTDAGDVAYAAFRQALKELGCIVGRNRSLPARRR